MAQTLCLLMNTETRHRRGDFSPCGTRRFWGYQARPRKDGTIGERWIPTQAYDAYKAAYLLHKELALARREWFSMQQEKGRVTA